MENLMVVRKNSAKFALLEEQNAFTNKEGSDIYKIRKDLHPGCNSAM